MSFTIRRNDIKEFPFSECARLNNSDLELWANEHSISSYNSWMLPQFLAYFNTFKLKKDEVTDQYNAKQLFLDNISGNDWALGIWRICTKLKRSVLVKGQNNPTFSSYSTLVPLILSAFKKYRNIGYEQWDKYGIEHLMNADLYEAVTFPYNGSLTSSRLLELREMGLTTKTGLKAGAVKKATSCWCLTGLQNTEVKDYPKLTMTILAQIWVAHPSLRNNLMILDPINWDNIPEPLIPTEMFENNNSSIASSGLGLKVELNDIPWSN